MLRRRDSARMERRQFRFDRIEHVVRGTLARLDVAPRPLLEVGVAADETLFHRHAIDLLLEPLRQEIDRVAMERGLVGSDAYLEQWTWRDVESREGAANDVLDAVEAELTSFHSS